MITPVLLGKLERAITTADQILQLREQNANRDLDIPPPLPDPPAVIVLPCFEKASPFPFRN